MYVRAFAVVLVCLHCTAAVADIALNSLRVDLEQSTVSLQWGADSDPYAVYRSTVAATVSDPGNYVLSTNLIQYEEALDSTPLVFYRIGDPPPGQPTCSLSASASTIAVGASSDLTWNTVDALSVTLNFDVVAKSGVRSVRPVMDRTYTLTATGSPGDGPAICQQTVAVTPTVCSETTPCIEWCGDGVIDDLAGGQRELDGPEMVHVLILPEGYTATDLGNHFENDVDDWYDEWEFINPYAQFRDAFCIWKQPVPSNERVESNSPQTADTAFLVPVTSSGLGVASSIPLTGPTSQRVWSTVVAGFPYQPSSFYPDGGRTHEIAHNLVGVVLVANMYTGRSGLSGRSRRLENPADNDQRLSVAFAHNRPHEFSHAFSRVNDEYLNCCSSLCEDEGPNPASQDLSNVVCDPACDQLPWQHLLAGGTINPSTSDLVGSFGIPEIGYHPEFKCLMNGTHDNAVYYGGNGNLRTLGRMCNYCRELTVFRLFERVGILDDPQVSWADWGQQYRGPFFAQYGFTVPNTVPQENSLGTPVFEDCALALASAPEPPVPEDGCDAQEETDPDALRSVANSTEP